MTEQIRDQAKEAEVGGDDGMDRAVPTEPQTRIAQLEESVASRDSELAALKGSLSEAVTRYRSAVLSGAPGVPGELVQGQTFEEIDASLEKARSITLSIQGHIKATAASIQVPAGAPARPAVNLDGLSGQALIQVALRQEKK